MSEIPVRNRKLTRDRREPVWPPQLEPAFEIAKAYWEDVGKHGAHGGSQIGQNQWISNLFYFLTGIRRTPRQVASHLQQRRAWFKEKYGAQTSIKWDDHILAKYTAEDVNAYFFDYDDESVPSLIPDSPSDEFEYDPLMPATPPPGLALPPPVQPSNPEMPDALAVSIGDLGNSWVLNPTPIDATFATAPSPDSMSSWLANYSPNGPEVINALFQPAAEPATFYQFPAIAAEVGLPYDSLQEPWVFVENPINHVVEWDDGLAF